MRRSPGAASTSMRPRSRASRPISRRRPYAELPARSEAFVSARRDPDFARFARTNLFPHKVPGYAAVTVSLKPIGAPPGDATSDQMRVLADLAERFSFDELRVTHVQNLVLPHVRLDDVPEVWAALVEAGLATANAG
jgi:sulfite reductase (NADPH) hemoprotein beta-component